MSEENQVEKDSEHDYATFIISNSMQADGTRQPQIVYRVTELNQEDLLENATVIDNVEFSDVDYEVVADADAEAADKVEIQKPSYRRETSVGSSGYWSESDVHRLLKVFLKYVRQRPLLRGKPSYQLWNSIIRDFDTQKKFAKIQVKSKLQRLKNMGKAIEMSGMGPTTKWPFWKQVSEILQLEKEGPDQLQGPTTPHSPFKGTAPWDEEQTFELLKLYRKNLGLMCKMGSASCERRTVWSRIASALGRPRYQVTHKFQALKAKWRRWKKLGMDQKDHAMPLLTAFNKIMASEKVARRRGRLEAEQEQEQSEVDNPPQQKIRNRWNPNCTVVLLKKYEIQLKVLKESGLVTTRRSVYAKIAREMEVSCHVVQVKLSSLKGHFKKFKERNRAKGDVNRKTWRYSKQMAEVMRLENEIWTQAEHLDKEHSPTTDDDDVSDSPADATKQNLPEPTWFRLYRQDVEKRHQDRVQVLTRLLQVIQQIAKK